MTNKFLNSTTHSVSWLRKAFINDELEVKPSFQRNPVWTDRQKSFLIDSILRGYPIPELYIQEFVDASGKEKFVVVDGQQRIRACLEFLEGKFAINGEDSVDWADMTFENLASDEKKRVYQYNFVVRVLPDMPEEELRIIFGRVNRNNLSLNAQELRHGTYWGPFIKTMEKLANHEFWAQSGIFSANDVRRMLDVEYVSELVIGMLHGPQNKKQSLDEWYRVYEGQFEAEDFVVDGFGKVLGEIRQVLPDIASTRWRKRTNFYTLFLVFANHLDSLPLPSDKRAAARKILITFIHDVGELLRDFTRAENYPIEVIEYGENEVRSGADLQARKRRAAQLEAVLRDVWQLPPTNDMGYSALSSEVVSAEGEE